MLFIKSPKNKVSKQGKKKKSQKETKKSFKANCKTTKHRAAQRRKAKALNEKYTFKYITPSFSRPQEQTNKPTNQQTNNP
eukprot:m.50885 g.50885  ORF g.50885 m.50885 type:complete len:80 (+) comp11194_c0_seq3:644-883(+)